MAREGIVFTHAYAQAPITTASHASILTGTYPQFHKVNDFGVPLGADLPYAPDILRKAGYHTAAFVGSMILDPVAMSAPGFDRGFDVYDAGYHRRRPREDRYQAIERRADEVVGRAIKWLRERPKGPFFLWVHLYDAHDPYDPPEPFKSRYRDRPYDGEIAYTDAALGKLVSFLQRQGLYDNSVIAVTADHGEALGEHGENTHGVFLYEETMHVPLLMKLPRADGSGARVESRVSLVDVLPTILDVIRVPRPADIQGVSRLAMMKRGVADKALGTSEQPAYCETDYPYRAFGWQPLRALRSGRFLFISAPRRELYDLVTDPGAKRNVEAASAAVADTMARQLEEFRRRTYGRREAPLVPRDPDLQEKLSALGYVASDNRPLTGVKETGADPKDKIAIVNMLHQAELLEENSQFSEAVPLLEAVIAKESAIPIAYLKLGTALSILRDYKKAIPVLRRAIELRPDLTGPQFQLGSALFETGDFEGAAQQFESSLKVVPQWAEARFSLATTYARLGRMPDAIAEYQRVIAERPNHYAAHLLMGRALARTGKPGDALPYLSRAARLQPDSPEPHAFLADAYSQLGENQSAQREREEAARLSSAPAR